jgi:predicted transcriptional regulator
MKERVEVNSTDIARVLTDVTQVRLLEPFFDGEITLSDAAKKLNVKLTTLLYHVTKFMQLGILEVSKEEARKGKAVKYYQTTAKAFFVSFDITPSTSLKHLLAQLIQPTGDVFNREITKVLQELSPQWGIEISSNQPKESGVTVFIKRKDRPEQRDIAFDPEGPAVMGAYGSFNFDFSTAKNFQRDLRNLLERYQKLQTSNEQLYFYRIGLTPVRDDSFDPKD